jgi:hypothetical protein
MTIRTLVTVFVGPLGKFPQIPAFILEWDEFEDGDIADFFDDFFFKYALGAREAFEARAEEPQKKRGVCGKRLTIPLKRKRG